MGVGRESVNYRLRDWLISRQRYWGSPIPIIHRADGTTEAVADADLPVTLPENVEFTPEGRSPLTVFEPFLNTHDRDGNPARRETDTMDTFMCSSWYHLRYLSPVMVKLRLIPKRRRIGCRWMSIRVGQNMPPCTCSMPAGSTRRAVIWAFLTMP
ncbi:MAG UNVERIFIED_CONTAM: class I tRNA ligase family protein [Anaerolineae bacterium]